MEELSWSRYFAGVFFLIWYIVILIAAYSGFIEILLKFRSRKNLTAAGGVPGPSKDAQELATLEGVTIIRPIKGIDPELSSCLESSFVQDYPSEKIQILFCVDNPRDRSIPIIRKLIKRYPTIDAEILISEGYNEESKISTEHYGPNPKVNNLAKGFIKAKFDILWVMDSNVWASSNILKNSVVTLNSNLNNGRKLGDQRPVKLVHHVPLAVCTDSISDSSWETIALDHLENRITPTASDEDSDNSMHSLTNRKTTPSRSSTPTWESLQHPHKQHKQHKQHNLSKSGKKLGATLDEMFLHTSHSKFYISLNNLAVAPCVNGKSNIYRKSDLDQSVKLMPFKDSHFFRDPKVKRDALDYTSQSIPGNAIKFFSRYIGEDNMIGIALWENCNGRTGLTGDVVVQPLSPENNTVQDYVKRRVRWLRVRKYMVLMATLIEPTTESIVCGIYGTFAVSTVFFSQWFSIKWFLMHMTIWLLTDYIQYNVLIMLAKDKSNITYLPQWMNSVCVIDSVHKFWQWFKVWCIRELLALPIWIIAMWGHEIDWRGAPFKIKNDLTAEEL
ncbi:uncharacterized protein LODBEIA_P50050 [Lodderomyces beijingensis]|uniref:Ceramide glucosyltransferase n=1 Tax=Lodderomyces beijingensis TaxID=1775926 RepID=A0ABP0ZRJ5_9ASCO